MKLLDKILRAWRVRLALRHAPTQMSCVLDIGCDDAYLLNKLEKKVRLRQGLDPRIENTHVHNGAHLCKGCFPNAVAEHNLNGPYDAIFALAVFEHFSLEDLRASAVTIASILSENGLLIVTVPHQLVDHILDVLLFFRLIDGQAVDEHHGFNPNELTQIFSESLQLKRRKRFQLGLNNIFVFERRKHAANHIDAMS